MNRNKILILTLALWISLTMCLQVVCGQNGKDEAGVTIELTKLDVNDTNLDLSWKIRNNTDHDVWICDGWGVKPAAGKLASEVYMAKDAQTLVIRRRFDLRMTAIVERLIKSRYARLRAGEERTESLSLTVPVRQSGWFESEQGNAECATSLALEIGFYDEDLQGTVLHIVEVDEKISCDTSSLSINDVEIYYRYFGGLEIAGVFHSDADFSESVQEGSEQVIVPYTVGQVLKGNRVLSLEVDGVSIPYGSAPAAEEPANDEVENTPITLALTKLDVNDTNLDLSYKIKNNADHDVWICDSVSTGTTFNFEVYLADDDQTLVIRKRLDILPEVVWVAPPKYGRYIRLQPAQEYSESLSLAVPVSPSVVYIAERSNAEFASRLVIEIGFYNEDVLEWIRSIIEVAERFHCASVEFTDFESDIMRCYFKGLLITKFFGGLSHFDEVYTDTNVSELLIGATYQLIGEQVLQISVDGVFIPYGTKTADKQSNQSNNPNPNKPD